jgi:homoserine O-acetyltransferase
MYSNIGDLKIQSGDTLYNCKLGYRTFGSVNADSSNIIIYPSWFGGTSEGIASLIEKKSFVDSSKYFIIAIDALGNGISSSPSNNQKNDSIFRNLTIRDMVNSQYKLLHDVLGIKHVFGAIGGSMGSMQVLEWSVAYPDYINKVVAYVASPKMTTYDLLWMNTQLNMIETLIKYDVSEKEIKKISDMITEMIARTPDYIIQNKDINDFPNYLASFDKEPSKVFTIKNYIAQLKAMMKHDISNNFNKSMNTAVKSIKAKLFIIVSETDMVINPSEAIKLADLLDAKKLILQNNCGHLAVGCEIERCREEIDLFLSE